MVSTLTFGGWALLVAAALALRWILETGFPRSDTASHLAAYVVLGGCAGGILCWVVAAFMGPAPRWWRQADGQPRRGSSLVVLVSLVVVPAYATLALPWLAEDSEPLVLIVGATCAVAALRAASPTLTVPLAAMATGLVTLASGDAALVLGHGALAIGLAGVLAAAVGAERSWVRGLAAGAFLVGLLLWLYVGWLILFLYGCGPPGCFS